MYHKNSSTTNLSSSQSFHRSILVVPRPVYPCYTESMMDLSSSKNMTSTTMTPNDFLSCGISYDDLSSTSNVRHNLHTTNYRHQRMPSSSSSGTNSRFKERLTASSNGLKELDVLREKHRKMIQEVKNRINFSSPCVDLDAGVKSDRENSERTPSPAPSANEMCSNMSYRSSLSMDSGCMSINSDPSAYHAMYGTDGNFYSLPPSRKTSSVNNMTSPYVPTTTTTTVQDTSDDEGCYPDAPTPQLSQSYASIPNLCLASADPPPKPPFRYRRRGLQPPRPRSLYSYPEENTVTVQADLSPTLGRRHHVNELNCMVSPDKVYRANKIYISPRSPPSNLSSSSSMSSIPSCLRYAGRWSRPGSVALPNYPTHHPMMPDKYYDNVGVPSASTSSSTSGQALFTWEQVKRLLDPDFDNRRTLVRQYSTANVNNSKFDITNSNNKSHLYERGAGQKNNMTTVCSQEHIVVSRSVSSQSSDSTKSRMKEKSWHESEHL